MKIVDNGLGGEGDENEGVGLLEPSLLVNVYHMTRLSLSAQAWEWHYSLSTLYKHRKNSPLIRIDGDVVQLQRTEYGWCQTDVELHGVRLAVHEHEYLFTLVKR